MSASHQPQRKRFFRRQSSTSMPSTTPSTDPSVSSRRSSWIPKPPKQTTTSIATPQHSKRSRIPSISSLKPRLPRSDTEPLLLQRGKENAPPSWDVQHRSLMSGVQPTSPVKSSFSKNTSSTGKRPLRRERATTTATGSPETTHTSHNDTIYERDSAFLTGRLLSISDRRMTSRFLAALEVMKDDWTTAPVEEAKAKAGKTRRRTTGLPKIPVALPSTSSSASSTAKADKKAAAQMEPLQDHRLAVLGELYLATRDEDKDALRTYAEALLKEGWDISWMEVLRSVGEEEAPSIGRRGIVGRLLGWSV